MMLHNREVGGGSRFVMLQAPGLNTATLGVLLMVAIHLMILASYHWGGRELVESIYLDWAGLSWEGVRSGRIWQLVTHAFLHGSLLHLAINALLFYYAAARLSHFMSSWRIAGLFFICAIGSGVAHLVAQSLFPQLSVLVGASGGITGLLLGFFSISPDSRMMLLHVSAGNLCKGILIASAFLFVVSPDVGFPVVSNLGFLLERIFGPAIFQAAHLVHFTGGIMGWFLIGRFLPRLLNRDDLVRMRMEGEARAAGRGV
jgi:membrane associated rhomboid family serine protease